MLQCPECNRVSQDGSQKFCTEDGARLAFADQAVEQSSRQQLPRQTPPGELLAETFVSPADNLFVETVSTNNRASALSFQSYGLHSANVSAVSRAAKSANGFHSFSSQIIDENEAETGGLRSALNFDDSPQRGLDYTGENDEKQRFGTSFIIICLLSALLFLTALAFTATYLIGEQGNSSPLQLREISRKIKT